MKRKCSSTEFIDVNSRKIQMQKIPDHLWFTVCHPPLNLHWVEISFLHCCHRSMGFAHLDVVQRRNEKKYSSAEFKYVAVESSKRSIYQTLFDLRFVILLWICIGLRCPLSIAAIAAWASPGLIPSKATDRADLTDSRLRTMTITLSKRLHSWGT